MLPVDILLLPETPIFKPNTVLLTEKLDPEYFSFNFSLLNSLPGTLKLS